MKRLVAVVGRRNDLVFYYYGRKKRLANLYPAPKFDIIIEPFAGSAAYSLHSDYWKRQVILVELDQRIYSLWKWLQGADKDQILSLPEPSPGEFLSDYSWPCEEAKQLASLHTGPGKNKINNKVSKFSRWSAGKKYVATNIHKIKHWKIMFGDYKISETLAEKATWFIDPPYQKAGQCYPTCEVVYEELAEWSLKRKGQVICCEQEGASWLPFTPLAVGKGPGKRFFSEVVWLGGSSEDA